MVMLRAKTLSHPKMTWQPHDAAFHMIKIIKLIGITTILVTGFIATGLLMYGAIGASLCPQDWKRDADGKCLTNIVQSSPDILSLGVTNVSDPDRKAYLKTKKLSERQTFQNICANGCKG